MVSERSRGESREGYLPVLAPMYAEEVYSIGRGIGLSSEISEACLNYVSKGIMLEVEPLEEVTGE